MTVRPCLDCGQPTRNGSRCVPCDADPTAVRNRRRTGPWQALSRSVIAEHLEQHGPICPGWRRSMHRVDPADLTTDHIDPDGPDHPTNCQVLCRPCNSAKSNTPAVELED